MEKTNLSKKILLSLAVIVIFLLLLELGLRIYHVLYFEDDLSKFLNNPNLESKNLNGSSLDWFGPLIRPSPYHNIIYEFKPNLNLTLRNASLVTNSHGWRDKERTIKKPNNTIRIVGIGDSVMFGWGVDEGYNYLSLLETKLNKEYPEFNWEVLNFALPAYNLAMELAVLKNYALNYDPDIIIYGYVGNDICLPDFIIKEKGFFSSKSFILDYLFSYYKDVSFVFKAKEGFTNVFSICEKEDAPVEYAHMVGLSAFENNLEELNNISATKNIPVIFFHGLQWAYAEPKSTKYKVSAADYFNLKNLTKEKMWVRPDDAHPSRFGHEIHSETLFRYLNDSGLINYVIKKYE